MMTLLQMYASAEKKRQDEAAVDHQAALDALHHIGCKYNMATPDIAILCLLAQISLTELMNNTMGANA